MYPKLYKEYKTMSEVRMLTSLEEVHTVRVACSKCEAVLEIPRTSWNMPSRCFNCEEKIPDKVVQAGEYMLRALHLLDQAGDSIIKLQVITTKDK